MSPLAHGMSEKELVSFCERGNNRSLSIEAAGVEETALEQLEMQQDVQHQSGPLFRTKGKVTADYQVVRNSKMYLRRRQSPVLAAQCHILLSLRLSRAKLLLHLQIPEMDLDSYLVLATM